VELKGEGRAIMRSQLPNAESSVLRDAYRIGSESQIVAAAGLPRITVGSHTWSHSNLASLDLARIDEELRASRDWLRERAGSFIPWLSYPYGLFSPDVERIASDLNYDGSLMVDGGWVGARARAPHRIPRFNVPARISVDGFRLRLSGLGAT
ncbi:MAG TPA: polysaccharide deacetylase family protein, partial [Gemmatimonadaceae bacterium]